MRSMLPAVALAVVSSLGAAESPDVERLDRSAEVFTDVMQAPDKGIPQDLLDKAQCVVVIPELKKGAFIVGAKYGRGFFSCRKQGGGWSAPGAVRVEGGSVGFQIGGQETDVIMLVMNDRGADRLLSSKFTLGGDASVAAGPVGRTATAETDAYMTAQILTWSRSRGIVAGISLSGATLREDRDTNKALYGKNLANKEIVRGATKVPAGAGKFVGVLTKYSSRKG